MVEKMEIIPINKKVLLKPIQDESKTAGGILLAESRDIEANKAEIIALGDKVELKLNKGDKVIYEDIGSETIGKYILVDELRIIAQIR